MLGGRVQPGGRNQVHRLSRGYLLFILGRIVSIHLPVVLGIACRQLLSAWFNLCCWIAMSSGVSVFGWNF